MKVHPLEIPEVCIIEPSKFADDRGYFSEVFNDRKLKDHKIDLDWVQDNHAMSREKNTLRGLHFQRPPFAQSKLVRVTRGSIFDVAVDIRNGSPTFGKWVSAIISAQAWNQILVPQGFAHGYLTLEANTEVLYKVDNFYSPESDAGIVWNDSQIAIDWPLDGTTPVLSEKDAKLPTIGDIDPVF